MTEKVCTKCNASKPLEEFYKASKGRSGRMACCKECFNGYRKERYDADTEEYQRRSREQSKRGRAANPEKVNRSNKELRAQILREYGGQCACCGEKHSEFLALDHVEGDGAEHRRRVGGGVYVYREVRKLGFPKDKYRLLCHNCNQSLGAYGYCPHQMNKEPEDA